MKLLWKIPFLCIFVFLFQGQTIVLGSNEGQGKSPFSQLKAASWMNIRKLSSCSDDLERLCPQSLNNNLKLLFCLKGDPKKPNKLKEACQHDLWKLQMNVAKRGFFDSYVAQVCQKEIYTLIPCRIQETVDEMGGPLFCLLAYSQYTTGQNSSSSCRAFLKIVSRIIFADLATLKPFLNRCESSIEEHNCGRMASNKPDDTSSHGDVLDCLHQHRQKLPRLCFNQMSRLLELRGSDYHLDTNLYFACRRSREELCPNVKSGDGNVLECLMNHKFDSQMRMPCKRELFRRQKLRAENYKTSRSLAPCDGSIERYQCDNFNETMSTRLETVRLSSVILCLESKHKLEEDALDRNCLSALTLVRRQIMEDFRITPSIVVQCGKEIEKYCVVESVQRQGKTLHCLMKLYGKSRQNEDELNNEIILQPGCEVALQNLVAVVDPTSNIAVDPVINTACSDVIHSDYCRHFNKTALNRNDGNKEGQIYSCLTYLATHSHVGQVQLNELCRSKLVQMQFILVRNWALSNQLFRACHQDAMNLCNAPKQWYIRQNPNSNTPPQTHITFHCLYQKMRDADLSLTSLPTNKNVTSDCRREIKRVLGIQASRIDLNPMLYEACLGDISKLCPRVALHTEYQCLQTKIHQLQPPCRERVVEFAQAQSRDFSLDKLLMEACSPMANRFCRNIIEDGRIATADMMACLIKVKQNANMESKCRAAIEHHQILSLSDYHISFDFTKHCDRDTLSLCPGIKEKNKAVSCLSEHVLLEYLGRDHQINGAKVSPLCRQQLRFELFQRSDSFKIDVNLQLACNEDVERFCRAEKKSEKGVNLCLQSHEDELSEACREKITKRANLMVIDSSADAQLYHQCNKMMIRYCSHLNIEQDIRDRRPNNEVLQCLHKASIEDKNFQLACSRILVKRLAVLRKDYRLDPQMKEFCQNDIDRYCGSAVSAMKTAQAKQNGVLQCLKDQYVNTKPKKMLLEESCFTYIRQLIREANLNFHLDPVLKASCKEDVNKVCSRVLERTEAMDGDGSVVNCLKKAFVKKQLSTVSCQKQIIRLLREGRADVHVDATLYSACLPELQNPRFCGEVVLGGGQQFSCLLKLRETRGPNGLSNHCLTELNQRLEMWSLGSKIIPGLDSMMDIAEGIQKSNFRLYILAILTAVVAVIFCFGICFGRCTKRKYERLAMKVR